MGNCNSKLHVKHTSFTYPTAGLSVDWRPDTQNGNSNNSSSSRNSGSSAAGVFGSTDSGSQRNPSETQQQPSRQDGSDGGNAGTEGGKGSSNGATAEAAKAPRPDAYELTEEEVQAMLHCLRLRQRHGWGEIVREARAEWLGWRLKFAAGEKVGDRADYARRVESWAKRFETGSISLAVVPHYDMIPMGLEWPRTAKKEASEQNRRGGQGVRMASNGCGSADGCVGEM